jgi:hypothetical protein
MHDGEAGTDHLEALIDDNSVREAGVENHPLLKDDGDVVATDHVEERYIYDETEGSPVVFLGTQVVLLVVCPRVSLVSLGRVPSSAGYRLSSLVLGCDHRRSSVVVVQEILTLTLASLLNRPSTNPSLKNSHSLNCCNSNNSRSDDSNNYFWNFH